MNKAEIFYDAITGIRETLIEEAQEYRFHRRQTVWRRYAGLAACLALVAFVGFGAVRLGVFGGMGMSSNNSASGAAPADSNGNRGPAVSADQQTTETVDDTDGGQLERESFTAKVLEVHDAYLLVEPLEGESIRASADRVMVPTGELSVLPALSEGDMVTIAYTGDVEETYPVQITGVEEITPAERK